MQEAGSSRAGNNEKWIFYLKDAETQRVLRKLFFLIAILAGEIYFLYYIYQKYKSFFDKYNRNSIERFKKYYAGQIQKPLQRYKVLQNVKLMP